MADKTEPAVAYTADAKRPERPARPDDRDSDTDSWERASATEDEEEEATGKSLRTQTKDKDKENHLAAIRGVDGAADENDRGEGHIASSGVVTGDWGDGTTSETPDSDASASGIFSPAETNPFRRKISNSSGQHSVTAPLVPIKTAPELPSEELAKLNLNDTGTNPWDTLEDQQHQLPPANVLIEAGPEPAHDIWGPQVPSQAVLTASPPSDSHASRFATPEEVPNWDDPVSKDSSIVVPASFQKGVENKELHGDSHAWDDVATLDKGKAPMTRPEMPSSPVQGTREEEWNLIDTDPTPGPPGGVEPPQLAKIENEKAPALPPRQQEKSSATPSRSPVSAQAETYQVKNINWLDANETKCSRKSPILVQNANGPCPLMALVNALTLTTPAGAEDAVLVNTLRTREQISLDLLLSAVFDELMSERRMTADVALPDMTELYSFLMGLHTGMNVNPRFIPTEEMEKAFKRTSLTHLHPTERGDLIPGTFEDTREMAFYKTFQIPLIHGWLPSKENTVYEALKRQAVSYEDAQNVLFREEELENKLSNTTSEGLTEDEEALYHDIQNIKSFLHSSATQLTTWGLEVITKAMRPGSVAILFRNDHFSTLYRHPQTLEIFALVTDAGYAGHQEVVWESLRDVNGERSEFVSGDFRIVGGPQSDRHVVSGSTSGTAPGSSNQGGKDLRSWTAVQGKKGKEKMGPQHDNNPLSPSEQEDRDLALAMQLQDEEDQRHNTEQLKRRRETQLSEQFIEQQNTRRGPAGVRPGSSTSGGGQASSTPAGQRRASAAGRSSSSGPTSSAARGGRPAGPQQVRSLVPPVLRSQAVSRAANVDGDDAPPSYEDAARDRPYVPPAGHPAHPNSSPESSSAAASMRPPSWAPGVAGGSSTPRPSLGGLRRGTSAVRQGVPPGTAGGSGRDKECIVM